MDIHMDVLRTDDFLRTKISWKHRLPYFLTHGALMDVGQGQFFSCHICRTMVCWDAEILLQRALYLSVTFFVELIIRRGSYIQCMKRLRKGENICVLFENPTHCSIGTAGRRNKCREDHGSYRCSSQSRNCVFNCNDLLCI